MVLLSQRYECLETLNTRNPEKNRKLEIYFAVFYQARVSEYSSSYVILNVRCMFKKEQSTLGLKKAMKLAKIFQFDNFKI